MGVEERERERRLFVEIVGMSSKGMLGLNDRFLGREELIRSTLRLCDWGVRESRGAQPWRLCRVSSRRKVEWKIEDYKN